VTSAIRPWRAAPPEPSYFSTVAEILALVRGSDRGVELNTPSGQTAANAIPRRLSHTQVFMAWAVYYGYPDARRMTLEALDQQ
jgi:hypothetical protein